MAKNEFKELYLKTEDGINLAIDHFENNKKQVLIIANGWTMSKDSLFIKDISRFFAKTLDVISFDFRGHGKSSGIYTFTSKEPRDLRSVVNYANEFYKEVYLMGFSLGGAVSIIHCACTENITGLITVSAPHSFAKIKSFNWIQDFLKNPFKKYELKRLIKIRPSIIMDQKINPIDVVDKIKVPTLFIAGALDSITNPLDTKSLFDKAKCEKKFELFKDCNHAEDLIFQAKNELVNTCTDWIFKINKI